ncbi:Heterokaryon incompatibility protein 6 [Botryosphaeria dothidea]|uniref:Heterokaryon incompatibility protein 6 n=1 Tax=Botryosphaeria dothidea TaxID=55169 RepID=A0A8H4IVE3_9PEZI|nr:Heterokaryon incompatibility protein 6 [Botryosphaeria dothidea]
MATQTEDGFSYQTLDPRYSEIRLVKLLPIPKSSDKAGYLPTIHCSLRKASLEDDPEYNALSYVWGDPRETRPILIDGKPFRVTVNLEAALRQLAVDLRQQRRSHTWLWVDAICINQTDTSERTHQVCQMSQLYRGAARVIVWLGPPAIDSDTAISTLHRIHDVAESSRTKLWVRSWPMFQFQEAPRPRTSASYIQAALDTVLEMLCADDHRCLDAVASLYERDWFRRVWVVQEVALAREAVLHCGDTKIDWATFYTAFWMLCGLRDYLNAVVSPKSRNLSVATFLNAKLENVSTVAFSWVLVDDETPLRQFLYFLGANANHSRLLASDERDYCFALLGLACDTHRLRIRADYEGTWKEVRIRLAKSCLEHYGLEMLSHCNITASTTPDRTGGETAPSWVPNWASPHLPKALSVYSHLNVRGGGDGRPYCASGSLRQHIDDASFNSAGKLKLWAIYVDVINEVGEGFPGTVVDYKNEETFDDLAIWLAGLRKLLPSVNEAYKAEKKVQDALWRAPIADRAHVHNYESIRAPAELEAGYKDLLNGGQSREAIRYASIAYYKLNRRRPFRASNGLLGIGPEELATNDHLWIPLGAHVPLILREAADGCWTIVGEAYIHGIMDGELTHHSSVQVKQIQIK